MRRIIGFTSFQVGGCADRFQAPLCLPRVRRRFMRRIMWFSLLTRIGVSWPNSVGLGFVAAAGQAAGKRADHARSHLLSGIDASASGSGGVVPADYLLRSERPSVSGIDA